MAEASYKQYYDHKHLKNPLPKSMVIHYDGNAIRRVEDKQSRPIIRHQENKAQDQVAVWQNLKKIYFMICIGIVLISLFGNLLLRWKAAKMTQNTNEIQEHVEKLIKENELYKIKIAESYDYQTVKSVAQVQGMDQVRDRVKEINK